MSKIQRYPKRLIEVDLPIKRISVHARREKSIRQGHISTLHIWWARRPLAACRAAICAALWPDPADALCPEAFRRVVKTQMRVWALDHSKLASAESFTRLVAIQKEPARLDDAKELRHLLLDFIADFANWDNSTVREYLDTSRALTQAAHEALGGAVGTRPLVVDPFAGGGSIPLEALRVGADAFASDLNPVAILLNKVVLEYIPRYGQRLADEVRKWGEWIDREAEKELAEFYPKDADGAIPIAYLWARTIQCEGPGCGAEVPLLRSLWLAKRGNNSIALKIHADSTAKAIEFEIIHRGKSSDVAAGTVKRASATCPCCGYTTPAASVRKQLLASRGGLLSARLVAVRQDDKRSGERTFRMPTREDLRAVELAGGKFHKIAQSSTEQLTDIPNEHLPIMSGVFNAPIYGHNTWGSLFSPRQAVCLATFVKRIREVENKLKSDADSAFAEATVVCLAVALDKLADYNSSLCTLNVTGGRGLLHTFARQALPMIWDFMETNPFNTAGANWLGGIESLFETVAREKCISTQGTVQLASAAQHPMPDDSAHCIVTDPPYYNAVPYADLSDFFFVWLKRTLRRAVPELFSGDVSPKDEECCEMAGWDPDRYPQKDAAWFEEQMRRSMAQARRVLSPNGIAVVVFAHKSTTGWETMLGSLMDAGWTITSSWPIDTERPGRLRALNSAVLGSSVHLVCRPREHSDGSVRMDDIGDWRDVLQELPSRIHLWMPRLVEEGIVGADAIFACLGPALEIFSRYSSVEKSSGEVVTLKEYLEHVWAAVAREALSTVLRDADASALEPDARLSVIWLWTLGGQRDEAVGDEADEPEDATDDDLAGPRTAGGFVLEYDAARKLAQGLGAKLEDLAETVEVKRDKARLLPVAERAAYLFGTAAGVQATKKAAKKKQIALFDELEEVAEAQGWGEVGVPKAGMTTLDRLHQAMLFFASGRSEALKRFIVEEGVGAQAGFWKLAQAMSALYPRGSDEKRWVDGMLARKKTLGF